MHQSSKEKIVLDAGNRALQLTYKESLELSPLPDQSLMMSVDQPYGYPEKPNPRKSHV